MKYATKLRPAGCRWLRKGQRQGIRSVFVRINGNRKLSGRVVRGKAGADIGKVDVDIAVLFGLNGPYVITHLGLVLPEMVIEIIFEGIEHAVYAVDIGNKTIRLDL